MIPDATTGLYVAFGVMFTAAVMLFWIVFDDLADLTKSGAEQEDEITALKERVAQLESQINVRDLRGAIAKHLTAQASLGRVEGNPN